jgi:hypothetical protein
MLSGGGDDEVATMTVVKAGSLRKDEGRALRLDEAVEYALSD